MNEKAVLIISGGMDSVTLLYDSLDKGYDVRAISIDYGQKHIREIEMAHKNCEWKNVPHTIIDLSSLSPHLKGSALTDDVEVPKGHYAEDTMKATVVPNRNMIMLSVAIAFGISHKADVILYGAHSGDHDIYPDCRKEFVEAMQKAVSLCDWHSIRLEAPYLNIDKGDIVEIGLRLKVPYQYTHTCYEGKNIACGHCGCCVERVLAFDKAGTIDPIRYADGWNSTITAALALEKKHQESKATVSQK